MEFLSLLVCMKFIKVEELSIEIIIWSEHRKASWTCLKIKSVSESNDLLCLTVCLVASLRWQNGKKCGQRGAVFQLILSYFNLQEKHCSLTPPL